MDRLKIKGCKNIEVLKGFGSNYVGGSSTSINVRIKKLKISYPFNLVFSWISFPFILPPKMTHQLERLLFITIYLSTYISIRSYAIILS